MTAALQAQIVPRSEVIGAPGAPVVVALGGISATGHVASHRGDFSLGWWQEVVGEGAAVDTRHCQVLSFDFLTATHGPTTTHQQADALAAVLDARRIARIHAIVGASYGGMVGLAFAERYPDRVARLVLISAPHESHPMSTAIRVVQRRILRLGLETGRREECVALARALGITTYRTAEEFADRFDREAALRNGVARFPVEDYLDRCGQRFAGEYSAERYLALSESLDLHRVDPSQVTALTTVVAVDSDTLVPRWQLEELRERLGGSVWFQCLRSRYGHDAFLKEPAQVGAILTTALALGGSHAA